MEQRHVSQRISDRTREGKPHPALGPGIDRQQVAAENQVEEHQEKKPKNSAHAVDDDRANLLRGFGEKDGGTRPNERGKQGSEFADEVQFSTSAGQASDRPQETMIAYIFLASECSHQLS